MSKTLISTYGLKPDRCLKLVEAEVLNNEGEIKLEPGANDVILLFDATSSVMIDVLPGNSVFAPAAPLHVEVCQEKAVVYLENGKYVHRNEDGTAVINLVCDEPDVQVYAFQLI